MSKHSDSAPSLARLLVIGVVAWALFGFTVSLAFPDWTTRGQFGEMFGAINALFSRLALAGVIYTVLLQRKQLSAQERESSLNARLTALAALITAYTERANYFDTRSAPNTGEVVQCQTRIRAIATELEEILARYKPDA